MDNMKGPMDQKKIAIVALVVAIILVVVVLMVKKAEVPQEPGEQTPSAQTGPEGFEGEIPGMPEGIEAGEAAEVPEVNPILVDAVAQAPGANLVATNGDVVTDAGIKVRTDVSPMAPEAPRSSVPITKDQIASSAVMLDISAAGFSPAEFTVKAGEAITIALTSTDQWSHNIKFDSPLLASANTSVSAGTTRAFSFNAPTEPGTYTFKCDIPGHAARGEVGQMIVVR